MTTPRPDHPLPRSLLRFDPHPLSLTTASVWTSPQTKPPLLLPTIPHTPCVPAATTTMDAAADEGATRIAHTLTACCRCRTVSCLRRRRLAPLSSPSATYLLPYLQPQP